MAKSTGAKFQGKPLPSYDFPCTLWILFTIFFRSICSSPLNPLFLQLSNISSGISIKLITQVRFVLVLPTICLQFSGSVNKFRTLPRNCIKQNQLHFECPTKRLLLPIKILWQIRKLFENFVLTFHFAEGVSNYF